MVDASGRDRPGLLGDLAMAISRHGLSIQSAHIDNYGERAVDAFDVTDLMGHKIASPAREAAIKRRLRAAFDGAEPRGEARARRREPA